MISRVVARLVVFSLTCLASTSLGSTNEPRQHDSGFFLRLSTGGGFAKTSEDFIVTDAAAFVPIELNVGGPSGDANFAIGAIVSPNLAVHASLFSWAAADPTVEINGLDLETNDVTLTMSAVGAGVTWYAMPANVYISPSVGAASLTIDVDGDEAETNTGIALDLTIGKEWWVGNRWGLGIAVGVGTHSVPDSEIDERASGSSFAVRFTATMN